MSVVEQPVLVGRSGQTWEPGSSFVDLPEQELAYDGIPGWLQTFGESVAADPLALAPEQLVEAPVAGKSEPNLPSWLEEPRPVPAGVPDTASLLGDVLTSDDGSGFITEDDLPEWLRSIADESLADGASNGVAAPATSNGVFSTPSITLAWVTAQQMVALAPGETLFARIAGEEVAPSAVVSPDTTHHVEILQMHPSVAQEVDPVSTAAPKNNLRVLLLAALLMVVVLIALMTLTQR